MIKVVEALKTGTQQLSSLSPSARLDTEILLAYVLKKTRTFLYTYPDYQLTYDEWENYSALLTKRQQGIPIAYIIGKREFWSLNLTVNENTLIPRPETELLIELALQFLGHQEQARVLDLGTGSGAIALAIASEKPSWEIIAVDYNLDALKVAEQNAKDLKLNNIHLLHSNWFSALEKSLAFDIILANPPYIAEKDTHLQQGDVRFEPQCALVSGPEGLTDLQIIVAQGIFYLKPGGLLLVEHGFEQKNQIASMLRNYGYDSIGCWQDYQGHDRVSGGKRK